MNMPKIDKGVPLPPTRRYGPRAPIKAMVAGLKVGDSFEWPGVPPPPSKRYHYREKEAKLLPAGTVTKWAMQFGYKLYYDRISPDSTTLRVWRTA